MGIYQYRRSGERGRKVGWGRSEKGGEEKKRGRKCKEAKVK